MQNTLPLHYCKYLFESMIIYFNNKHNNTYLKVNKHLIDKKWFQFFKYNKFLFFKQRLFNYTTESVLLLFSLCRLWLLCRLCCYYPVFFINILCMCSREERVKRKEEKTNVLFYLLASDTSLLIICKNNMRNANTLSVGSSSRSMKFSTRHTLAPTACYGERRIMQ